MKFVTIMPNIPYVMKAVDDVFYYVTDVYLTGTTALVKPEQVEYSYTLTSGLWTCAKQQSTNCCSGIDRYCQLTAVTTVFGRPSSFFLTISNSPKGENAA